MLVKSSILHLHAPHPPHYCERGVALTCVGKLDCEVNRLTGVNRRRCHVRTRYRPGWLWDEAQHQPEVVAGNGHGLRGRVEHPCRHCEGRVRVGDAP